MDEKAGVAGFSGVEKRFARAEPTLFGGERDQLHGLARQEAERTRAREPSDVAVERHSVRPPGEPPATSL